MKKLIAVVLMLMVASAAFAQRHSWSSIVDRAGTSMTNYKYEPKTDTSVALAVAGYSAVGLALNTKDSLSIEVYYMPSYDGVSFRARVLIDSLSTAAANSAYFPIPAAALGFPKVKFSWVISAFREGTTNDTLSMKVYRKLD